MKINRFLKVLLLLVMLLNLRQTHSEEHLLGTKHVEVQTGTASWYGKPFQGKLTASGERYNMFAFTAAHRKIPLGSYVRVTNLRTGRNCVVKITDRGPWVKHRILDLSYAAAKAIGMNGVDRVRLEM